MPSRLREPLVRVAAGLLLVPHGAQKLFGWCRRLWHRCDRTIFRTSSACPRRLAAAAGVIEFFGGLLLAAGIATRSVAALVFGVMAVAVVQVSSPRWVLLDRRRVRVPAAVGIVALAYAIRGRRRYSWTR